MILVVGATGMLGARVVERLCNRGLPVRAMTRSPAQAGEIAARGAEVVFGDLRRADSVRAAARGASVIIGAAHGFTGTGGCSPHSVDRLGNRHLVDAAAEAGAHVILVSVVGASANGAVDLFRAKHDAEQYLWQSGVPATVVRATPFAETWVKILGGQLKASGRALVFGKGETPVPFVGVGTVADVVERAVADVTLRSVTLEVGGPEQITLSEFAAMLTERFGATGASRHVPRSVLRAMARLLRPFSPRLARQAGAALMMDTHPMIFDGAPLGVRFPDLLNTGIRTMLAAYVPPTLYAEVQRHE